MKKKLICLLLAFVMLLGMVSAFAEGKTYKIGVIHFDFTTGLGLQVKNLVDYFCEAFDCEAEYVEVWDSESIINGCQNLIESGCDVLIAGVDFREIMEMCEENGVYMIFSNNTVASADNLAYVANMKYFVAQITEDDYEAAYNSVVSLYDQGCRNIALIAPAPGYTTQHDTRVQGVHDALAAHPDINVVAEYRGTDYGAAVVQFAALYPEMDGIINTENNGTVPAALISEGLSGKVKLAVFDFADGTEEAVENGDCV